MAIQQCPNGHQYDSSIYGNNCPFCPSEATQISGGGMTPPPFNSGGGYDAQPAFGGNEATQVMGGYDPQPVNSYNDAAREERTQLMGEATQAAVSSSFGEGRTVIRGAGGEDAPKTGEARRLVGLLVTYSIDPNGQVFPIYEGRNIIGRDQSCDIALGGDDKVSSKHLVILWRPQEGIMWGEDQMSSNGTYLNGEFVSEKFRLRHEDVLLVGDTKFVYLAIPQF